MNVKTRSAALVLSLELILIDLVALVKSMELNTVASKAEPSAKVTSHTIGPQSASAY